ncbi:hypothetical protein QZH41_019424, partial [Actinostola sp. cb2023]
NNLMKYLFYLVKILNKKVPENPKYKHVRATVDTGSSISKYLERIEDMRKNYKFKKDEIFKRMKSSTFAQLVLQVAQVIQVEHDRESLMSAAGSEASDVTLVLDEKESMENVLPLHLGDENGNDRLNTSGTATSRSTLQGLIHGVGEIDLRDQEKENHPLHSQAGTPCAPDVESLPYLILDLREKDAFDLCHIIGAMSYPSSMLSRSYNYFTKEILMFKNKPGKIIILYDEDERLTGPATTTFVQRDVDNVFMLSGGLKVLVKKFGDSMITGRIPASCVPTPPPTRKGSGKPRVHNPSSAPSSMEHINYFTSERILDTDV